MIQIRHTLLSDLPLLMHIFERARAYMAQNGNPHQWVNRPTSEDIRQDILRGCSYVCLEDEKIVGTFAYISGPDPTYANIYGGTWPDDESYGVIHRLAGSSEGRGVADAAFAWALLQCDRLRIDTHEDNHIMQAILQKYGFTFCGTILLEDGSPRWAYFKKKI